MKDLTDVKSTWSNSQGDGHQSQINAKVANKFQRAYTLSFVLLTLNIVLLCSCDLRKMKNLAGAYRERFNLQGCCHQLQANIEVANNFKSSHMLYH